MSIFLVHGFKWGRDNVRIHTLRHNIDDVAPNNLMSGKSEWAMKKSFEELFPGPMAKLSHLRFIEPLNPNNEKHAHPAEAYVFVCDFVVRREDSIDVQVEMAKGVSPTVWEAMAGLRDTIAEGAKIGWYAVHNGDLDLAKQEREGRKEENGDEEMDEASHRIEEGQKTEQNFSAGLNDGVARMQVNGDADRKQGKRKPGVVED